MFKDFLNKHITSQCAASQGGFVEFGYAQVEPNKLSAQKTGQIFAQLPADAAIEVLEQGQFAKYDYASGLVNFTGAGEWMLVFNEIKLYREDQWDCEFAMLKDNYQARIYSPYGYDLTEGRALQSRYYNGVDAEGNDSVTIGGNTYKYDDVTAGADYYEPYYTEDPYHIEPQYKEARMPEGTSMVPRLFKTNLGDIYTTNCVKETSLEVGDMLYVGDKGLLVKTQKTTANANGAVSGDMAWQVVKVYTMPDGQAGVKIMRVA